MISVIDMPPPEESSWWRGKKGFEVGFFPSECVEVIGDKVPHSFKLTSSSTKPVFRKHGKLIAFFRSFLLSRPSRRRLKQSGILKERVFGCDLGEHLLNTCREIPLVLKCCTEFIEEHGVVDGIYRLSGVSSNIQRLRLAFDEDRSINLGDPATVHDIHSVASLLKMYFRELPNPLLTYQLYDKFVSAVQSGEEARLLRIRDVVQQLPPPHFRTLQYLLSHLARVASYGDETGMTPKNIAIVWAPNLLRSRDVENGGVGALHVVGVQAVLTEYLIRFSDLIFDDKVPMLTTDQGEAVTLRTRPKSLAISTPTKLLSLEEARARALSTHLPLSQQKYIEVGGGPDKLPSKYHTVIDLPLGKSSLPKLKKSPSGWKSFFSRGWYSGSARDKCRPSLRTSRKASTGSLPPTSVYLPEKSSSESDAPYSRRKKLRTVKSAESLVHCAKESSQNENKEDVPGPSHKSVSPLASTDSSNSFEMTSPLSKSPSLQKHTRSSSHESYFESNSMDIISEPSFEEDEQGLFYYMTEQMRMLQDASTPLHCNVSRSDSRNELPSFKRHSKFFEYSNHDCDMDSPSSGFQTSEVEKNVRKQKLSTSDDFAHAKVQKLSVTDVKGSGDNTCSKPSAFDENGTFDSVSDQAASYSFGISPWAQPSSLEKYYLLPETDSLSPNTSNFLDNSDFQLDPILIYDSILNKHNSCISLSDNETEVGSKTVVERYGNAETVLVEVHATQDSSSEEEPSLMQPPLTEEKELPNAIVNQMQCRNQKESTPDLLMPKSCIIETVQDVSHVYLSDSDSAASDKDGYMLPVDKEKECEYGNNNKYGNELNDTSVRVVDSSENNEKIYHIPDEPYSPLIDSETAKIFLPESTMPKLESNSTCDSASSSKQGDVSFSSLVPRNRDLKLKLDITSRDQTSKIEPDNSSGQSYHIITPPSPVYPVKCSKFDDFQSLRIKMENIPIHSKKKILNIPSPSSPVEEVRKKFELHAANSQKNIEVGKSDVKSPISSRDISKLSSKHKVTFEKPEVNNSAEKRKSEGLQSIKNESMLRKRNSEPSLKMPTSDSTVETKAFLSNRVESLEDTAIAVCDTESPRIEENPLVSRHSVCHVESPQITKAPVYNKVSPKIEKAPVCNVESSQSTKSPAGNGKLSQTVKSPVLNTEAQQITKSPVHTVDSLQMTKSPENQSGKSKPQQPSLFTQLKIRKLQSLKAQKGGDPPQPIDPWSDPILDSQGDYHPMVSLSQIEEAANATEMSLQSIEQSTVSDPFESEQSSIADVSMSSSDINVESVDFKDLESSEPLTSTESSRLVVEKSNPSAAPSVNLESSCSEIDNQQPSQKTNNVCVVESEAVKRERINRIKEERRAQLREKLKTESFRLEAEEKEKVQTKFRLRKDSLRHSSQSMEVQEDTSAKEVTKSDKAVETDSTDITETGTYCDLGSIEPKASDIVRFCKIVEHQPSTTGRCSVTELDLASYAKMGRDSLKQVLSETDILQQNKPTGGRKSNRSYEDSRKWLSMPPSDIRDKVAIFERSKDANELCRLGPTGKFPPKQNASSLASSFVR